LSWIRRKRKKSRIAARNLRKKLINAQKKIAEELKAMYLQAERELTDSLDGGQERMYRELTVDPIELKGREFGTFPTGK